MAYIRRGKAEWRPGSVLSCFVTTYRPLSSYNRSGVAVGMRWRCAMTLDHAVALSLQDDLPRVGLTDRLLSDDPLLLRHIASADLRDARDLRMRAAERGIGVLAWNDPRFPAALLATTDCPPALWFRGELSAFEAPAVAIVGSRAASPVALEAAARIGEGLAAHGVAVVSGLARGADSAAHRGALRQGRTVAVLGSGVDR